MKEKLLEMEKRALQEIEAVADLSGLEKFRVLYLGKKGLMPAMMKALGDLPAEERGEVGRLANRVKVNITKVYGDAQNRIEAKKGGGTPFFRCHPPGKRTGEGKSSSHYTGVRRGLLHLRENGVQSCKRA